MGKTYTPLSEIPGTPVARCSQILANKLQCWRPGDFLVSEDAPAASGATQGGSTTSPPAASNPLPGSQPQGTGASATSSSSAPPSAPPPTYQLCAMHKVIQERADKLGGDKALDAMLGVQLKKQQNPPHPSEEKWPEGTKPQYEKDYEDMMAPEDSKEYQTFQKRLPELEGEEPGASTANAPSTPPATPAKPSSPTSAAPAKESSSGTQKTN